MPAISSVYPALFWLSYSPTAPHSPPSPFFFFLFAEPGADTVFLNCLVSLELDFRLAISQETDCLPKIRLGINNHNAREMWF